MKISSESKVPLLRFNDYVHDGLWKLVNLGTCSKIVGGGTPATSNKSYWNGQVNWYSPVEIGHNHYVYESRRKITNEGLKHSSAKLHPKNTTILFTSRAGIGDMAILKTPAATNQGFQSLELKANFDTYFVYSYGFSIKRQALKLASGSTFLEVSNNSMSKIELYFPKYDEQKCVGNFFQKLDYLIQLQQQKIEKLRQLKKGYLQKMFFLNENGFPKLRLNKFYFGWTKINFKYLMKLDINKNVNLEFTQENTLAAAKMRPNNLRNNSSNEYLKTYNIIRYSEIAYEGNNSKNFKYGRFVLNDFEDGIISHVFPVYKFLKPFDMGFMKLYIHSESVMQKILLYSTTQSLQMDTLKSDELYKQKIRLPSLDEQIGIGKFLKKLDNTLYYNHLKLSNLKKLKQGYLQKMFC